MGATTAMPGGRFTIFTHQSREAITFTVANSPASERWGTWVSGQVTRNFPLNARSNTQLETRPDVIFRAYPALVRAFAYDNFRKSWQFYDPEVEEASDLERLVTGHPYYFLVSRTTRILINGRERVLSCLAGNCWNQIVW